MDVVLPKSESIASIYATPVAQRVRSTCYIMYTRASTLSCVFIAYILGNPKGVIINHGNVVSSLAGAYMKMVREGGERRRGRRSNKVQKSLGGHVRFILTGSTPIDRVLKFYRCAFGCMVSTHIYVQ